MASGVEPSGYQYHNLTSMQFRKEYTSDAMAQNALESLFQGHPIPAEIGKKSDLSEQVDVKAL